MSDASKTYSYMKINKGTVREKDVELIKARNIDAKITEHKYYIIVDMHDKIVAFPSITPNGCIRAFCELKQDERIRVYFGDPSDGHCDLDPWNFKHNNGRIDLRWGEVTEGYVSPSWSPSINLRQINNSKDINAHVLVIHHYAIGMFIFPSMPKNYLIRPETIVRIEHSNKKYGGVIWSHPNFGINEDILSRMA